MARRASGYWWNEISWPYNTITDGENVTQARPSLETPNQHATARVEQSTQLIIERACQRASGTPTQHVLSDQSAC